ncbi:FmdB family zinc ribbon protein [Rhodoferax lithotrophicus]|uniref:FmdB family zinc ribbon protein n=1 Tax=Rhodoferax lithotrophicus TaxID=2798804 RepID=UPI001CC536E3|nr:zinc ribbon domain-containing protein [Rhodoferax sp. MIZ03]
MPIYEYSCGDCGHEFEALVRSDTTPQCPICHSGKLEKLLSVFATTAVSERNAQVMPSPCGSCPNASRSGSCTFDHQ